jgi:hypothetical protein
MAAEKESNSVTVFRLDQRTYRALEDKLSRPVLNNVNPSESAIFNLGIEHVLKEIRNGITVSSSD